jgi:DNA polymerase-3 subunit delta'
MPGFREIAGHDKVKEYFKKSIGSGNISHAYILAGEEGTGRKSLAKAFAMTLLCENSKEEPCGVCHSCRRFLSDNHPDVKYITHEKASSIGVKDIREQLVNDTAIRPYSSDYKIYIIDEAEKLTVEAQNALLKTIEEPPAYVLIFFLTNNADSFLPTILSRCVTLKLQPLYDSIIKDELMARCQVDNERANLCTALARGNLGRAMDLAESEEFMQMYQDTLELLHTIYNRPVYQAVDILKRYQEEVRQMLDLMKLWYRDVTVYKATQDLNLLIFKTDYANIQTIANRSGFPGLDKIVNSLDKAVERLNANVGFELTMELLVLTIKEN